jgi:hypothetical protein
VRDEDFVLQNTSRFVLVLVFDADVFFFEDGLEVVPADGCRNGQIDQIQLRVSKP